MQVSPGSLSGPTENVSLETLELLVPSFWLGFDVENGSRRRTKLGRQLWACEIMLSTGISKMLLVGSFIGTRFVYSNEQVHPIRHLID